MARQTWIADTIRSFGVEVVEVDGWRTRGSSSFSPRGLVVHHTASRVSSNPVPALRICRDGRSDLPGPLCQVLIGRDAKAYIIAAGRANHAGHGGWKGLSGNSSVFGIETEHKGTSAEPWSSAVLETFYRVSAALLKGISADPITKLAAHKEWAPKRKIDPYGLDMNKFRQEVANRLNGGGTNNSNDNNEEDEDMKPMFIKAQSSSAVYLSDYMSKWHIKTGDLKWLQDVWNYVGMDSSIKDLPDSIVDSIPNTSQLARVAEINEAQLDTFYRPDGWRKHGDKMVSSPWGWIRESVIINRALRDGLIESAVKSAIEGADLGGGGNVDVDQIASKAAQKTIQALAELADKIEEG